MSATDAAEAPRPSSATSSTSSAPSHDGYRKESPRLRSCWRHHVLLISRLGEEVQLPLPFSAAAFSQRCLIFPRIISADWDFCAVFDAVYDDVHTLPAMHCADWLLSDDRLQHATDDQSGEAFERHHGAVSPLNCSLKVILFVDFVHGPVSPCFQ